MAMYQKRALQAAMSLASDDSTFTLKLPKRGALAALEILMQWKNGSTSSVGVRIFDAFDKIEIIANGSYQIFSLTPMEAFQWGWLHFGRAPAAIVDAGGSIIQDFYLTIPFGLPIMNSSHFLPLDQYDDLELRISYSPAISATVGFATGQGVIAVYATIAEEKTGLAFAGYLRNRTIFSYTSAASGVEKIRISGSFPILALLISSYEAGVRPHTSHTLAEITLSDGAIIHYTDVFESIRRKNMIDFNLDGNFTQVLFGSDGATLTTLSDPEFSPQIEAMRGAITPGTTVVGHYFVDSFGNNEVGIEAISDEETSTHTAQIAHTTDVRLVLDSHYNLFPRGAIIPFGYPDKLDQTLLPSAHGRVHLEITDANVDAAVRISQLEIAQVVN